jgi:hypothetical protein
LLDVLKKQERFAKKNFFAFPPWYLMLFPVFVDVEFVPIEPIGFGNYTMDIHRLNVYYDNTHIQALFEHFDNTGKPGMFCRRKNRKKIKVGPPTYY